MASRLALLLYTQNIAVISTIRSYHIKWKRAPGPFPIWPLLGNLPLLHKLPHQVLYNLSKTYGDIMELKLGSICTIVISSPQMAIEVLKTHDQVFASRPLPIAAHSFSYGGLNVGWAPQGDYWRHLRKLKVSKFLSKLDASKNVRDEEISFLVHSIFEDCKDGKPTNMRTRLCNTSMNVMTRLSFGKRYFGEGLSNEKNEEFQNIIMEQLVILGAFNISDFVPLVKSFDLQGFIPKLKQLRSKIDEFFDEIIQNRLKEKHSNDIKDYLDVMLSIPETYGLGDRLGDNVIKAEFNENLAAGTDTSAITTEWALAELLKHPKFMKKIQDELDDVVGHDRVVNESDLPQLKYLQAVVKETFRLHPPTPLLLPRESIKACEINGYHIPPKTRTLVNIWAIHRDSSMYENPFDFNPERFVGTTVDLKGNDFQLLPFGSGRRMCPGLSIGLTIVQMELARLLHSFTWRLPNGENIQDIDMGEVFGLTTPKAIPLDVIATSRLPSHFYASPQLSNCGD
ncbi:unnamed protein product [Sphagnum jensenii]|uniref:Cytochrome P450 n=1 Tax=Sphagnum jensenii TaxID=128206 RepID=A0ABP1C205_9BRYO